MISRRHLKKIKYLLQIELKIFFFLAIEKLCFTWHIDYCTIKKNMLRLFSNWFSRRPTLVHFNKPHSIVYEINRNWLFDASKWIVVVYYTFAFALLLQVVLKVHVLLRMRAKFKWFARRQDFDTPTIKVTENTDVDKNWRKHLERFDTNPNNKFWGFIKCLQSIKSFNIDSNEISQN